MTEEEYCAIANQCKNAPPEQKENALNVLTRASWELLFEEDIKEGEYAFALRFLLKTYAQKSFDAENTKTQFVDTLPPGLKGQHNSKGITLNIFEFTFSDKLENYYKNMEKVPDLLITISHEFTHEKDSLANNTSPLYEDKRAPSGTAYKEVLDALGNFFPENKDGYTLLGEALYYSSNDEKLAKQISYAVTKSYVERLDKITNEYFPNHEEIAEKFPIFCDAINSDKTFQEACDISNMTPLEYKCMQMKLNILTMKEYIEKEKTTTENLYPLCEEIKQKYVSQTKKDFLQVCNKLIDNNSIDQSMPLFYMVGLIKKPEFFDLETAKKIYNFALKENNVVALGHLSTIEELGISKKDQEKYQKLYNEHHNKKNQEAPQTPPSKKEEFHF